MMTMRVNHCVTSLRRCKLVELKSRRCTDHADRAARSNQQSVALDSLLPDWQPCSHPPTMHMLRKLTKNSCTSTQGVMGFRNTNYLCTWAVLLLRPASLAHASTASFGVMLVRGCPVLTGAAWNLALREDCCSWDVKRLDGFVRVQHHLDNGHCLPETLYLLERNFLISTAYHVITCFQICCRQSASIFGHHNTVASSHNNTGKCGTKFHHVLLWVAVLRHNSHLLPIGCYDARVYIQQASRDQCIRRG
mmetsp:Transcript_134757/g.234223  ORF Transcript_134757/g.234223 Transcript_134757/m.234223 type:complete len:249 (+) Transcript_134757:3-749(+)